MRPVPAVVRAISILNLFLDGCPSLSVPEIVAKLGLPRTTVHELVQTLTAAGYLIDVPNSNHRFALGLRVFELGSAYLGHLDLATEGLQVAREVAAACEETVHLAILDGTDVIYIGRVDSVHAVRLASAIGRRLPAHLTGLGKMLLSSLSDDELACRYGEHELQGMTPTSITSMERLKQELAETRARGYAFDNSESSAGVQCVAAPIYDYSGAMVAAMSIAVPIFRVTPERWPELIELIQTAARKLSHQLGCPSFISAGTAVPALTESHGPYALRHPMAPVDQA